MSMEEVPDSQEELGHYCYQLYQHKVSSNTFVSLLRKIDYPQRSCTVEILCTEQRKSRSSFYKRVYMK